MSVSLLLPILAGCTDPKKDDTSEDTSSSNEQSHEPKTILPTNDSVTTNGNNQSLIPSIYGDGCYVVSQNWGEPAQIQFAAKNGFASETHVLANESDVYFGWGTQLDDGRFAIPYTSADNFLHGVTILDDNQNFYKRHNFATSLGHTGTSAVLPYENQLVAINNNGDYSSGVVTFDDPSALVTFYPDLTNPATYTVTYLNEGKNATGLGISGDQALVASAGEYFTNPNANGSVTWVDLSENEVSQNKTAPAGLGLNGNVAQKNGFTLLTGYNSETPLTIVKNKEVYPVDLPQNCQTEYVQGGQFVQANSDLQEVVFNSHDYSTGEMSLYHLYGDVQTNSWECDVIDTFETSSATAIMSYGANQYCVATANEVYFYEAE